MQLIAKFLAFSANAKLLQDDADLRPALVDAEKRIAALEAQLNNEVARARCTLVQS